MLIGTRGSQLALRQTQEAVNQLQGAHPRAHFQLVTIASAGDNHQDVPIDRLGVGVFVRELEVALLHGEIDIAVHSLKDLPTEQTPGLAIAAIARREDPSDALVDRWGLPLERLPAGARLGTGSPRRIAQLRHMRPDLNVVPIRGNVTTRLDKAVGGDYDGVVLALAGLRRLGMEGVISQVFSPKDLVPAPGQGALALETRAAEEEVRLLVAAVQHYETFAATTAEREFLRLLGGGCRAPYGAYGRVEGNSLALTALLGETSGQELLRATVFGSAQEPLAVARTAYDALMSQGAARLIDERKT
ncbi:MAG: hydroxymethylbilane synthase [Chloroflexi bacterium]|nr:hydroxymethylbilane synthase [Chloroflexota bacterium]